AAGVGRQVFSPEAGLQLDQPPVPDLTVLLAYQQLAAELAGDLEGVADKEFRPENPPLGPLANAPIAGIRGHQVLLKAPLPGNRAIRGLRRRRRPGAWRRGGGASPDRAGRRPA